MDSAAIRAVRTALGLTQGELAQLLGVHLMSVGRWERGEARPTSYQEALLADFGAVAHPEDAGARAAQALATSGVAEALRVLLVRS